MQESLPINIMIHDLSPWGGQDRSMLEIAWQLNKKFPLKIHSYTLKGYDEWPNMQHIKYKTLINRPVLFKYINYHIKSLKHLKNNPSPMTQSTGTASLRSDTVQVQFIHHSWLNIATTLPKDKTYKASLFKKIYYSCLNTYKKQLERKIYTPNKHYIAISHGIKKELMEHFKIPSKNITTIHHGVDYQHFHSYTDNPEATQQRQEIRQKLDVKENDFVLLHVGALNSRKGLFQALRVVSFLKKNGFENIKYLAVGQGGNPLIQDLIDELDLENEVILAPHSKDIRNYYWASDVFFFPTFYEPFGLAILEAMACGLPCVVSARAGGAELLQHGENGLLFNPTQPIKEIANTLVPLMRDADLKDHIARKGRQTAKQRSWEQVGNEYKNFYTKLTLKK